MESYYEEIIEEIRDCIKRKEYETALSLVNKELSMPYIPAEAEEIFLQLKKDAIFSLSLKERDTEESTESLLRKLKGKPQSQLYAVSKLTDRNLHGCIDEIRDYLAKDPCVEAAALLVEGMYRQNINDEFVWMKDGVEYTFWVDSITPVEESEGFLEAMHFLDEWLSNDQPAMYELARKMLIHEAYCFLPLSYEADEGRDLAEMILKNISEMMDDSRTYSEIIEKN